MKGFPLWTAAAAGGAVVAVIDPITGWTVRIGLAADAILLALFALIAAVLLFTNCSGLITPTAGPAAVTNAIADPGSFLTQTGLLVLPFLLILALAPLLVPRYHQLAVWALFLLAGAAPVSLIVGFYATAITCGELGPLTLGACAASGGSLTDVLSAAALLLYVPYVAMIGSARRDAS